MPRPNQLYLFLPGTKSEPNKYDDLLSMAAYAGYKTIGLSYDNTANLEKTCANSCGCYGPARRDVVSGTNLSSAVSVQAGDSITYRLYLLLKELHARDPLAGWDDFLSRDNHNQQIEFTDIDWDAIVVSGHSQGAGHAMVISKTEAVDGILLFDGGDDDCMSGVRTYAQWHDWPDIPSPRRAFIHDRPGFSVPAAFIAMEFGVTSSDFVSLDTTWPTSFEVATTSKAARPGCTAHGSMAYDGCMPDALGNEPATPADAYLFPFYVDWMCEVGS
ncbi:BPSS1187 family protein [Pyxidicoccus xibeiensis]|uniref:BPSS1187 family protein n=1 Tax=Pyxidicoccus xibeiensis TaxID=2906759 RepID=UPI0020A7CD71|nr:hypothetical protein [Pyxidicoccus xibeiensis]MCP3143141.1 hypothetical protein [Pyxidicoccus xibeiensis]